MLSGRVGGAQDAAQNHETVTGIPVTRLRESQGPRAGPPALGAQGLPFGSNDPGHEGDAPVPLQRGARVRPLQGAGARVSRGRGVLVFAHSYLLAEDNGPGNSISANITLKNRWRNIEVESVPATIESR